MTVNTADCRQQVKDNLYQLLLKTRAPRCALGQQPSSLAGSYRARDHSEQDTRKDSTCSHRVGVHTTFCQCQEVFGIKPFSSEMKMHKLKEGIYFPQIIFYGNCSYRRGKKHHQKTRN